MQEITRAGGESSNILIPQQQYRFLHYHADICIRKSTDYGDITIIKQPNQRSQLIGRSAPKRCFETFNVKTL